MKKKPIELQYNFMHKLSVKCVAIQYSVFIIIKKKKRRKVNHVCNVRFIKKYIFIFQDELYYSIDNSLHT